MDLPLTIPLLNFLLEVFSVIFSRGNIHSIGVYTQCIPVTQETHEMHQEAHDGCGYPLGHWVAPLLRSTLCLPWKFPGTQRKSEALFTECLTGN